MRTFVSLTGLTAVKMCMYTSGKSLPCHVRPSASAAGLVATASNLRLHHRAFDESVTQAFTALAQSVKVEGLSGGATSQLPRKEIAN